MSATPPARRERKKAQTRKALVEVALRLIGERGIDGTRIEDITERTDLGKGAFYNYFDSKNALVATLVGQGVELLCSSFLANVATLGDARDRVEAIVRGHEAFFAEHPVFVVLFHGARGVAKVGADAAELEKVFADYLTRIAEMVFGRDAPEVDARVRMDVAATILGAIAGHRSFRLAAGLPSTSASIVDVLVAGVPNVLAQQGRPSG